MVSGDLLSRELVGHLFIGGLLSTELACHGLLSRELVNPVSGSLSTELVSGLPMGVQKGHSCGLTCLQESS